MPSLSRGVPTGINIGVFTTPCAVWSLPDASRSGMYLDGQGYRNAVSYQGILPQSEFFLTIKSDLPASVVLEVFQF